VSSSARPVLVVLAAGASRRLGEPKALARLGGRSVLERLLDAGADLDDALVVTGAHDALVRAALAERPTPVPVVTNGAWERGRTGSIAAAARARPDRALLIAPVDVPLVSRAVVRALTDAWTAAGAPPRGFLAPCTVTEDGGRRHGHPVVVGPELARELVATPPDRPLRDVRATAAPLLDVVVGDAAIHDDLDTPADLARLRQGLGS